MSDFKVGPPSVEEKAKLAQKASDAVNLLLKTDEGHRTLKAELKDRSLPIHEVARRVKKKWSKPWIGAWVTGGKRRNTLRWQMRLDRFLKLMKPHLSFGVNGSLPSHVLGTESDDEIRIGPDFSNGFLHEHPQTSSETQNERPLYVQMRDPHDLCAKHSFMDGLKLADDFEESKQKYKQLHDVLMVSNHYSKRMMLRIMFPKSKSSDEERQVGSDALCKAFLKRRPKERSMLDSIQEESCALLLTAPESNANVIYPLPQRGASHDYKFTNLFEWEYVPHHNGSYAREADGSLSKMTLAQMLPNVYRFRSDPNRNKGVDVIQNANTNMYELPSWCVHELMFTGIVDSGLGHKEDMAGIFAAAGEVQGLPEASVGNFEKLAALLDTDPTRKIQFPASEVMRTLKDGGYHGSLSAQDLDDDPSKLKEVQNSDFVSEEEIRSATRKKADDIADIACERCGNADATRKNAMLICDGCNKGFHQKCYDISVLPNSTDDWLCSSCIRPGLRISVKKGKAWRDGTIRAQRSMSTEVAYDDGLRGLEKLGTLKWKPLYDRKSIEASNEAKLNRLSITKNEIRSATLRRCRAIPLHIDEQTRKQLTLRVARHVDITKILLDRFRKCTIRRRDGFYGQQFGLSYITSDLGPDADARSTHERFMAHGIALNTHPPTHTHTHPPTHTRAHTHTHAHTHRQCTSVIL